MKITFYGHACIGIEVSGKHILVDPFITANEKARKIKFETVTVKNVSLNPIRSKR
jgi:L-ascorbate metabolism protein UlaG (beta-lactamase superfamily)